MRRIYRYAFLLALVTFLAACSGSPYSRSTGEYVGDKAIASEVKAKLALDEQTKAHQIEVEVFRDTVQLSGFVDSDQSKQRAGEIARQVDGVKKVVNNLIVKEPMAK